MSDEEETSAVVLDEDEEFIEKAISAAMIYLLWIEE